MTVNDTSGGSGFSGLPTRKLTGRIKIHPAGYGFVVPDDKSEDVHVSARNRGAAMDADTVEIEAWPAVRGVEGRVLRVLARGRAKITGQLARRGKEQVLQPDDPRIAGPVTLRGPIPNAPDGIAVVAEITRYPDVPDGPIEAAVLKVLGDPDDPRTEVEKVLACADVEEEFPDDVARIADGLPTEVRDVDRVDRADLRDVPFTTIDPETARDFDDAVAHRDAAARRHAALGRGRRRLALRARGVAARRRGAPARLQHLPAQPRHPDAARAAVGAHLLAGPRGGSAGDGRAHRPRSPRAARRHRLLRGGDSLARAARLPGRGGGAGRRHPRQAAEVRAVPARAARDGFAGAPDARGPHRRAARSTSIFPSRSSSSTTTIRGWCATSGSRVAIPASGRRIR